MKKLLVFLILIMVSSFVFAEESFWCLNATENHASSGDHYRFDYSTVYDLTNAFTAHSGKPRLGDYADQNHQSNPLNQSRALGTVGVGGCEHKITYTINTNGGQFVSQSDPSKYCNFFVVIVPDFSYYYNYTYYTKRPYYYYDSYSSSYSDAPSTKDYNANTYNKPITITVPRTDAKEGLSSTNKSAAGLGGNAKAYYSSIGLDLFLCVSTLTDTDKAHMVYADDYIATITVEWHCSEGCAAHSGIFNMVVRGFYGTGTTDNQDKFLLVVNPTTDSTTLNIKDMIKYSQEKTIASLTVATTTKEGTSGSAFAWRDHIYAFVSASPNYLVSDQNGFVLKKVNNNSITIPYKIIVYNKTTGAPTTGQEFDGKGYYNTADLTKRIDLYDYSKSTTDGYAMSYDRYGTFYYAINYSGEVAIRLKEDYIIPGSSNTISVVMNNEIEYNTDYSKYIGKYESNIYYHIVYSDSPLTQ